MKSPGAGRLPRSPGRDKKEKDVKDIIRKLTEACGPSGSEGRVRELIRAEAQRILSGRSAGTDIRTDVMGNLIVSRRGGGKGLKVMLAAHMDEIGVVVTHVDEKGFCRFANIGGVRPMALWGSRVQFTSGALGVIGIEKLEDPGRVPGLDRYYIDTGVVGREDCRVKVGDVGCFLRGYAEVGRLVTAKALDDRIGCAILLRTMAELKESPHEISFVFTVQEEVGLRGAATSAYGVEPDLAIALDVTGTGDTPEAHPMSVRVGSGAAIKVKDGGMLAHGGVRDWMVRTAEAGCIPHQLEVLEGGTTDAMSIQTSRAGVPAGALSVPCRYVHSPSEMVDLGDAEAVVRILTAGLSADIRLQMRP